MDFENMQVLPILQDPLGSWTRLECVLVMRYKLRDVTFPVLEARRGPVFPSAQYRVWSHSVFTSVYFGGLTLDPISAEHWRSKPIVGPPIQGLPIRQ